MRGRASGSLSGPSPATPQALFRAALGEALKIGLENARGVDGGGSRSAVHQERVDEPDKIGGLMGRVVNAERP